MIRVLRKTIGKALRRFDLYEPYERMYCRIKYPQPCKVSLDKYTVSVRLEALSTVRFLSSFDHYEGNFLRFFFQHLHPGDCAWDVGANKGIIALFMAEHVGDAGSVYAFEPESAAFAAMKNNFRDSGRSNLMPMRCGLGRQSGNQILHLCRGGEHSLIEVADNSGRLRKRKIQIEQADALLSAGIRQPNALKIDVEGAEFEVLAGMEKVLGNPELRCIGIELHPTFLNEPGENLVERLRSELVRYGMHVNKVVQRGTELHCFCSRKAGQAA